MNLPAGSQKRESKQQKQIPHQVRNEKMKTNFKLNTLIRENIKSLKPYSSARDEYKEASSKKMIFLDANENPFEIGRAHV